MTTASIDPAVGPPPATPPLARPAPAAAGPTPAPEGRVAAALCYAVTGLAIVLGVCAGFRYLTDSTQMDHFLTPHHTDPEAAFANWDGQWYVRIARDGYSYNPDRMSSVAFFPVFPLVGRVLVLATGLDYDVALTLVSNLFFLSTLVLLARYVRVVHPGGPPGLPEAAAVALGVYPPGFFFRMAYSDSLFLFLAVLVLYGLARRWPLVLVAALVGLATAARPVGVALAPPVLLAVWGRYPSLRQRLAAGAVLAPLCGWGLAAYVAYQAAAFGDPLAFSKTQTYWRFRDAPSRAENLAAVATLKPFWEVYDESSAAYWRRHDCQLGPGCSLQFANPIYFAAVAGLVGFGWWRRWLTPAEAVFAAGVLFIPYVTKAYEGCMSSQARYSAVAVPAYIVLGRLLLYLPRPLAAAAVAGSGFLMSVYAALFAGWFLFI